MIGLLPRDRLGLPEHDGQALQDGAFPGRPAAAAMRPFMSP